MKKTPLIPTLAALVLPAVMEGADIMPDFGLISPVPSSAAWFTDRYEPASFSNVGTFQGRSDVLGISINSTGDLANRPNGYQSSFYNTQGRQHLVSGGAGSILSADLWVERTWADAATYGNVRTDVWGVMQNASPVPTVSAYPILGFTNYGGDGRFRYYDGDLNNGFGAWVDLADQVRYNAWNSLSIEFTGSAFVYRVNGSVAGTDFTINGSSTFKATIMQAYNFADQSVVPNANPQPYVAHWSNTAVPDASSTLSMLVLALAGFLGLRRRNVR